MNMPAKPKKLKLEPPLTEEEKARLYPLGITEEKIIHDPMLRFVGIFADDPDFMPMMRRVFRESRGREMPEWPFEPMNSSSSTQTSSRNVSAKNRKRLPSSKQRRSNNDARPSSTKANSSRGGSSNSKGRTR
jgi:hypothetical protein